MWKTEYTVNTVIANVSVKIALKNLFAFLKMPRHIIYLLVQWSFNLSTDHQLLSSCSCCLYLNKNLLSDSFFAPSMIITFWLHHWSIKMRKGIFILFCNVNIKVYQNKSVPHVRVLFFFFSPNLIWVPPIYFQTPLISYSVFPNIFCFIIMLITNVSYLII